MTAEWVNGPICFDNDDAEAEARRVHELYGVSGVYVYLVRPRNDANGIINVYAGKAMNLGWRIIQHSTSILGLMNEIYGDSGEVVFGKTKEPGHYWERLLLFSNREQLGTVQEQARSHLARTEFWAMRLASKKDLAPMEGTLAARLRSRQRQTEKDSLRVRCLVTRAPKNGGRPIPKASSQRKSDLFNFVLHGS